MKILWIGGWAIPINIIKTLVLNAFPNLNHCCIHPHEKYLEIIDKYNPDVIVGYSLGATLLLNNSSNIFKEYLIAPFLNIKDAIHINSTQLKYLIKWLKKDPLNAINDFYQRSQLSIPKLTELPYPISDLIWGLETLIYTNQLTIPHNSQILLGNHDPLINPNFFLQHAPISTIYHDSDHNLQAFLEILPF